MGLRPSEKSDFPQDLPRASFPDNSCGFSTVCPKLQETVIDSDISIIGINNSEAINRLIVQDKVKGKSRQRVRLYQESPLMQLPREVMVMIISFIPAKAVGALARSCKGLEDFVNQNYVESVIMPLSLGNMRKLGVRSV